MHCAIIYIPTYHYHCKFATCQDARRVKLVDGLIDDVNSSLARRGTVAHLAVLAKEALLDARRGTVTHRATK